jgi:predicted nucleotidyltransferase
VAFEGNPEAASMDQEQAIRKVKQFAAIVREHLPVCDVLLYGSYAKGRHRRYSDIDVAIVVERIAGDLLGMKARVSPAQQADRRAHRAAAGGAETRSGPLFWRRSARTGRLIASYS